MEINHEDLYLIVTVRKDHEARELVPAAEAAGLVECESYDITNILIGRVAVAAETARTIENVKDIPGVVAVEQEPTYYGI
jgi:hypothetical protein